MDVTLQNGFIFQQFGFQVKLVTEAVRQHNHKSPLTLMNEAKVSYLHNCTISQVIVIHL